ncbi:MAG: tRNA preQ1(34) S-adenosylmethionine ribosyltransferase-isomerase QueA [Parvularculaceae bacterium]
MRVDVFDFDLPDDRIALAPARPRDAARLLRIDGAALGDHVVRDLPDLLRPGDLLVVNDTEVIRAQLTATRAPRDGAAVGGPPIAIDATLHRRDGPDVWRAFLRPAKRARDGDALSFADGLSAQVTGRDGAEATLRFNRAGPALDAAIAAAGAPPLPPYIARKRAPPPDDAADYQTVYARAPGSVAAPTAGLHFTDELLARLAAGGVSVARVTLHVGAGTFLPVAVEDARDHKMHAERFVIDAATANQINAARAAGGRVVAVGTTSLRALETAADAAGAIRPFDGETDIFITPGYAFRAVDLLMTNFHLPRSTLFMLVCAFAGTAQMKRAYAHAIEAGYRFYSFGDASLLSRAGDARGD